MDALTTADTAQVDIIRQASTTGLVTVIAITAIMIDATGDLIAAAIGATVEIGATAIDTDRLAFTPNTVWLFDDGSVPLRALWSANDILDNKKTRRSEL
ncbi:hypothetical protein [Agrobacterium arsenijevicii]|uniref:Uncharacterized protein n=1 Tax=Agrobacterium arsenijevicii TaxID=1585697 RepID=A0ABR5D519_9HYPH|nr:hypothetical protein RP75_17915 [Agrobacterium arsenijevicii]